MSGPGAVPEVRDEERWIVHPTPVYRLGRWLLGLYLRLWHGVRVENVAVVPRTGPLVVVCNHQSFLDIPILAAALPRHVCFVARESLARSRFLAFVMEQAGAILVRPGAPDRRALRAMLAHLERGDCVLVFPEGTRTKDGALGEFKKGALVAAQRARVPVLPAGIRGAHAAWPRDAGLPRFRRPVAVRFAAPLAGWPGPEGGEGASADAAGSAEAVARCRAKIAEMVGDGSIGGVPPL